MEGFSRSQALAFTTTQLQPSGYPVFHLHNMDLLLGMTSHLNHCFSIGVILYTPPPLPQDFWQPRETFYLIWQEGATGIQRVEARDTADHPIGKDSPSQQGREKDLKGLP